MTIQLVRLLSKAYNADTDKLTFKALDSSGTRRVLELDIRDARRGSPITNIIIKSDDEVLAILNEVLATLDGKWQTPREFEREERARNAAQLAPPLPDIEL